MQEVFSSMSDRLLGFSIRKHLSNTSRQIARRGKTRYRRDLHWRESTGHLQGRRRSRETTLKPEPSYLIAQLAFGRYGGDTGIWTVFHSSTFGEHPDAPKEAGMDETLHAYRQADGLEGRLST